MLDLILYVYLYVYMRLLQTICSRPIEMLFADMIPIRKFAISIRHNICILFIQKIITIYEIEN